MKAITREEAMQQIKLFEKIVNNGQTITRENWDYIIDLMKEFNITIEDINNKKALA